MIKIKQSYLDPVIYLMLFVVSCLFIAIFSTVSSPLTTDYSADSSIFMTMGKMFLNGKTPYVDFFDHKGPSLILLEGLGQLILPYRPGIFILEVVNLFLTMVLVYKTSRIILSRDLALSICFCVLFFLSRFFNKGNTTEELSLIPLLLSLYYTCNIFFKRLKITPKVGFTIGLCFSFLFWLRINNAGAIVACCIFLSFSTIAGKDYKSLKNLIVYFIVGQLPFTLLYILYFSFNDGLYEMFYATFLFNFLYVESLFNFSSPYTWVNYLLGISLLLGAIVYYLKKHQKNVFLFSILLFVLAIITTNIGPAYNHYFILATPALIFALILLFTLAKKNYIKVGISILAIVLACNTLYKGYLHLKAVSPKEEADYADSYTTLKSLLDNVPDRERDKIFYYEVVSSIYPLLGIDANYKYFVFHEWHGIIDPKIYKEMADIMNNEQPLWVVIQLQGQDLNTYLDNYKNRDFVNILTENYSLFERSGQYLLYQLKDKKD